MLKFHYRDTILSRYYRMPKVPRQPWPNALRKSKFTELGVGQAIPKISISGSCFETTNTIWPEIYSETVQNLADFLVG